MQSIISATVTLPCGFTMTHEASRLPVLRSDYDAFEPTYRRIATKTIAFPSETWCDVHNVDAHADVSCLIPLSDVLACLAISDAMSTLKGAI